jgi:hypothetical protein
MASSHISSPPERDVSRSHTLPSVQDDDILWTEYLKVASDVDARLVKDWTSVIDAVLVFVCFFLSSSPCILIHYYLGRPLQRRFNRLHYPNLG